MSDDPETTERPPEGEPVLDPDADGSDRTDGKDRSPAPLPPHVAKGAARSSMAERFNLLFRSFASRFFAHFELDEAVVERLKALESRGSVVYVMRYSSRLDYFLFNTLFLRHGLRLSGFANAIHFYYYRPLHQLIPTMLRLKRARPREVEHA